MGLVVVLDRPWPVDIQDLFSFSRLEAQALQQGCAMSRRQKRPRGSSRKALTSAMGAAAAVSSVTLRAEFHFTTEPAECTGGNPGQPTLVRRCQTLARSGGGGASKTSGSPLAG